MGLLQYTNLHIFSQTTSHAVNQNAIAIASQSNNDNDDNDDDVPLIDSTPKPGRFGLQMNLYTSVSETDKMII